jgi:hypothetical protein
MNAVLAKNAEGDWYVSINDGQTEWLYWGAGLLEDAIVSIPALLAEYPNLENQDALQKLYDEMNSYDSEELAALVAKMF